MHELARRRRELLAPSAGKKISLASRRHPHTFRGMRTYFFLAVALVLVGGVRAEIDPKNMDTSVKPHENFFQYTNGGWLKTMEIPPDKTSWGSFDELDERNRNNVHLVVTRAAEARNPSFIEKLVGDFYASGMDEAAINAAGIMPLREELGRIAAMKAVEELPARLARLHRIGISAGFYFVSEQDPKNSEMVIAALGQAGLGLPDRDYYLREDEKSKTLRGQYLEHVRRIFELAGDAPEAGRAGADAVMKLETALAKGSRTNVELRDPVANYNRTTEVELQKRTPRFNWRSYFTAIGLPQPGDLDVGQPDFFTALDAEVGATPLADWQAYLRWHLLRASAPYLSDALVNENFAFYGKTLTGQQELRVRWKRVLQAVDAGVGEAVGQLYVKDFFPPEAKARMLKLVGNLQDAMRDRLMNTPWMDAATRANAMKKINSFSVKIGYPDKWRDYSKLVINRDSYVGNVHRAAEFNSRRDLDKIGKPVDRSEWFMSPPTVNAYYNPQMNEIVFPAGILQPPFFDLKADDAVNYGGIGAVIGHEITHGFDDQGRQFDAKGNLDEWWTAESTTRFNERAAGIVKQFNAYQVEDLHVNGELTQGENIADLGGLKIAYAALQAALRENPPPAKIDGFTPAQRFFLSWATVWRTKMRPEKLRMQVQTDPHSPAEYRANGPLSNLEEFWTAFDVPEESPMRRSGAARVEIW
jgi:predicted metalloendopeptidase